MQVKTAGRLRERRGWCGRSLSFWLLWLFYAFFSLAGWVRLLDTVADWYWLTFSGIFPGPLYLAITGAMWGLVGLVALIWFWLRRSLARGVGFLAAVFFALTYWLDRLLFRSGAGGGSNTLFALTLTVLLLGFTWGALRPLDDLRDLQKRLF